MPKLSNQAKKDAVKFLAAGIAALVLSKIEKAINNKADDVFGPDEEDEAQED